MYNVYSHTHLRIHLVSSHKKRTLFKVKSKKRGFIVENCLFILSRHCRTLLSRPRYPDSAIPSDHPDSAISPLSSKVWIAAKLLPAPRVRSITKRLWSFLPCRNISGSDSFLPKMVSPGGGGWRGGGWRGHNTYQQPATTNCVTCGLAEICS